MIYSGDTPFWLETLNMQNLTQKVKRWDIAGNAEEEESDYTYSMNLLVFLSQALDTA